MATSGRRQSDRRRARRSAGHTSSRKPQKKDVSYKIGAGLSSALLAVFAFFSKHFGELWKKVKAFFSNKMNLKRFYIILAVVFSAILVIYMFWFFTNKNASEIYFNETRLGVIKGTNLEADQLRDLVAAKLEKENGTRINWEDTISLKKIHASKKDMISSESMISSICSLADYQVLGARIIVSGLPLCTVASIDIAAQIKDNIINQFIEEGQNIIEKDTVESFLIEEIFVEKEDIITADLAYQALSYELDQTIEYIVKEGDVMYKIAAQNDLTLDEIAKLNPGIDIDKIKVGQKIYLKTPKPFISVRTVATETYVEVEPKKTEYNDNPSEPTSYEKIVSQGRDGQSSVTYEVVRINGFETERTEIKREITEAPVNTIIERGTKN